jgi:multimeric flavodoxin WrbA
MQKNILMLNGSPRKHGNTTIVLQWVSLGIQQHDASIECVDVMHLENTAKGCMGCRRCNDSDDYRCVIDDDTSLLISQMPRKDVIIFASPVYFGSVSAQMKQLIDRMYCLKRYREGMFRIHPDLANVSFGLVATAGADEHSGLNALCEYMQGFAAGFETDLQALLLPRCPPNPKDMQSRGDVREQAIVFGEQLAR